MRVVHAVLAVSLAANAAWVLTWALSGPSKSAPEDRADEAAAEHRAPDAAGVTLAASPQRPNANKTSAKAVGLPWDLASPPPALGEREGPKHGAYVPLTMEPAGRLAARLGRAATSEESAALTTMLGDFAANAADRLAREVAARRGRDEFVAHGGGPLLQRLPQRNEKKPTDEALVEILDFVAGREFEAAFPAGGYGPVTDTGDARTWDLRGVLVDGATIRFGAGEHSLSLGEAVRQLEYRPFPRDVTLIGAGATKTLLRVQIRSAHATGPIMNLVFSGMSLVIDDDLFSTYGDDAVCVRFANCRIATKGLQLRGAGALWFDNCEMDGTWEGGSSGRPVVARSDDGLVRFDRCALRLCPPLEPERVRAAVLTSCTLREQDSFSRLEASNVRLTSTIVQSLATREEWNKQLSTSRPLKIDEDSSRRR